MKKIKFFKDFRFFSPIFYFFQVRQENKISTGNSSSRPAIMSNVMTILENPE